MHTRLARAAVPVECTWNLDDLFVSPTAWEAELQAVAYVGSLIDELEHSFAG